MTLTWCSISLVPRPLPAFQCSREKWEGLVCNGTWPSQQGKVWNNHWWPSDFFFLLISLYCRILPAEDTDKKWQQENQETKFTTTTQCTMSCKSIPGQFQVKCHSCAVTYPVLLLFSWTLKDGSGVGTRLVSHCLDTSWDTCRLKCTWDSILRLLALSPYVLDHKIWLRTNYWYWTWRNATKVYR